MPAERTTYCRCTSCKKDAHGQGPGLVWVWDESRDKWIRGWPINA